MFEYIIYKRAPLFETMKEENKLQIPHCHHYSLKKRKRRESLRRMNLMRRNMRMRKLIKRKRLQLKNLK
jgi:Flp pilus assembly CpaF family ATPase